MKPFLITTAIDYPNGAPHIGHAYEKVLADVLARYKRNSGREVYFLTGVDQHGQKIQKSAFDLGITPSELVEKNTQRFKLLCSELDISNDEWVETSNPFHKKCVKKILLKLGKKGLIYRGHYSGFYSVRQEQFLTEKERGPDGEFPESWGEVRELSEPAIYFKISKFQAWLKEFWSNSGNVIPASKETEVRNFLNQDIPDLCISRPKSRLQWGIDIPSIEGVCEEDEFTCFVWFDALINYISFAGFDSEKHDEFEKRWPALHVIGKDIFIPSHSIYWPTMLHTIGFSNAFQPKFLVHGFWNAEGDEKMSKTLGNVVDPLELVENFGVAALRYYLAKSMQVGADATFSIKSLIQTYNSDLVNKFGNLIQRNNKIIQRHFSGVIPSPIDPWSDEHPILIAYQSAVKGYAAALEGAYDSKSAIEEILNLLNVANQHYEEIKPWVLSKSPEGSDEYHLFIATLSGIAELCLQIAIMLEPITPASSSRIFNLFNYEGELVNKWGLLPSGVEIRSFDPIFPRYATDL